VQIRSCKKVAFLKFHIILLRGTNVEKKENGMGMWAVLKWVYSFIRPYKIWLIIGIIMLMVFAGCDILGVYLIKYMVDNALSHKFEAIRNIIMIIAFMLGAGMVSRYLSNYATGKFGVQAWRDLLNKVVNKVGGLLVTDIEKKHSGDMISRINNDVGNIGDFLSNSFIELAQAILLVIGSLIYMLFINWKLLLISYISTPVCLILSHHLSKPIRNYSSEYYEKMGEVNSIVQDTIGGMDIIKAFNLEKPLYEKCNELLNKALKVGIMTAKRGAIMQPVNIIMYEFPYILCAVFGGYMAANGKLQPGELVAFIGLLRMLVNPSIKLPQLIRGLRYITGSVERLAEVLEQAPERKGGTCFELKDVSAALEFEDVTFGYNSSVKVLDKLSLVLQKNKTVALVGSSGCGKSTIISLICGFYNIDSGTIKLYGHDMNLWNLSSAREQFSLVSQDTYLFPDTIEANIRFGRSTATEEDVIAAAKAANAHEFIMEMSEDYKTLVGERGIKLSGGQRQRISIARAILKNAPILLLDEPTSALDTQSEALVQSALEGFTKNRTVLVIAHRLSTIKQADEVLVLNEGSIVDKGNHEDLMGRDGLYKQLYLKQFITQDRDKLQGEGA
jgi:ABC-type multidrug transport system fused ATPase/permease subunit